MARPRVRRHIQLQVHLLLPHTEPQPLSRHLQHSNATKSRANSHDETKYGGEFWPEVHRGRLSAANVLALMHNSVSSHPIGRVPTRPISLLKPPTTSNTSPPNARATAKWVPHYFWPCRRTRIGTTHNPVEFLGKRAGRLLNHNGSIIPPAPRTWGSAQQLVNRTNQSGSAIASSSRKAISAPCARAIPLFRAPDNPCGSLFSIAMTLGMCARTRSSKCMLWSTTTIISRGGGLCCWIDCTAARRSCHRCSV